MTPQELRDLLDLFMCSDPWPLSDSAHDRMMAWLEAESRRHGYEDCLDAHLRLKVEP